MAIDPTTKYALTGAQVEDLASRVKTAQSTADGAVTALSGKQDTLSTAQLAAVNSGINSTKVGQIATNTNDIASLQTTVAGKQNALNQTQMNAVNSGADTTKIGQIATNTGDIATLQGSIATINSGKQDKLNTAQLNAVNSGITQSLVSKIGTKIFYANLGESSATRHIYKNSDMTGAATAQELLDANASNQVILRMSTSATPSQFSDAYLQNTYVGQNDYQFLFLDERNYREYDATNTTDTTFAYSQVEIQQKLTAGTNITINGNTISAANTTYSEFTGATSEADGAAGLVKKPLINDRTKFLKGDGTWATNTSANNSTISITNNGSAVDSFTTNASAAKTIALSYPEITVQSTDPGEGVALAANHFIAYYEAS